MVDLRAVDRLVGAVEDVVEVVDQPDCSGPVVDFIDPVNVSLVAGHAGEAGPQLEEAAIRDRVLVHIAGVFGVDLPFEAAAAGASHPAGDVVVEDVGADGDPVGVRGWGSGKAILSGGHGCQGPEGLIVVALWTVRIFGKRETAKRKNH